MKRGRLGGCCRNNSSGWGARMFRNGIARVAATLMTAGALGWASGSYAAAAQFEGQVQAGGGPVMNSTVTLWAASAGDPKQLAQTKTDAEGHFQLGAGESTAPDVSLYVIAKGGVAALNKGGDDNPALAFLSVLGSAPPAKVVVNEMTTIASVVTHAQFIGGTAIQGSPLALHIAAGNVPNFVD